MAIWVAHHDAKRLETTPGRPYSRARWYLHWLAAVGGMVLLGLYHAIIYVPHLDEPHAFTFLDRCFDLGLAAVVVYCGLLLGLRCLRLLLGSSVLAPLETLALAAGLGMGMLSLTTLALGAFHLFYGVTFVVLLVSLPLVLWSDATRARELVREALMPLRQVPARWQSAWRELVPQGALALACLVILLATLAVDLTLPDGTTGYDTYQYHWAIPLLLLRSHGWQSFPGWAHANLPYNSEMLNIVALSVGAPQAVTMIQDSFALLSALLVFALIRRSFGSTTAWLAVLATATIPLMTAYTSSGYVETALVFYGLAAFTALLRWLEMVIAHDRLDGPLLALAGVFVGLALGTKYTAVEYLPGAAILILAGLGLFTWRRRTRHAGGGAAMSVAAGALVWFGGALTLAFAPWLLKDWILLGNPVYPALQQVFGAPLWNSVRSQTLTATFQNFGPHSGFTARFHLYALDLSFHPERYGEGSGFFASLFVPVGAALVVPCGVYAIAAWRRDIRFPGWRAVLVAAIAVWSVAGFIVWTFSGALVERYALPPVVLATLLGAVLLGWLISRVLARFVAARWLIVAVMLAACLIQVGVPLSRARFVRNPLPILSGSVSEDAYFRTHERGGMTPDFFRAADYINNSLPHDGKLLMLGRGTGYFFTERDYVADSGGDWVPYIVSAGKTSDGMLELLHEQGFTYVVYDAGLMRWLTQVYNNKVIASYLPAYLAFQQQRLIKLGQWGDTSLYQVPPSAQAAPAAARPLAGGARTMRSGRAST